MRKLLLLFLMALAVATDPCMAAGQYVPTPENLTRRHEFEGFRFGVFIHWGIYSTFARGEWFLNDGIDKDEYAKAADAFYPHRYDAREWVRAIKASGARYITFTTRHHDGFSMWDTRQSDYNIVRATPFGRDVLRELSDACREEGVRLHLYYSILDWIRDDYPLGRTGLRTGRTPRPNYDEYMRFMKNQVSELLTQYGDIGALWLDGYWDHDSDPVPFDWRMTEFYDYCHALKPDLLIGNNHHLAPLEGEDFQMFERDLPGENTAGLSGQDIGHLPLEMCQTMNGMWGYKVSDTDYKSVDELVTLIVRAAAKGSNLLLNVGPQPNGQLPAQALDRLRGIGRWMDCYGEAVYGTRRSTTIDGQAWGVATEKEGRTYLHVLDRNAQTVTVPAQHKPRRITAFPSGELLPSAYDRRARTLTVELPAHADVIDYIVEVTLK
ncbi:MAG: alpha-L-fucosidase [Bacteroidaceae bacterium]|nr:alpha-L-fucosidase [Bacteroidaceae bacterium]MBR1789481.1 alpha-L-fucosidase [Bacteroidaceae bacterium]